MIAYPNTLPTKEIQDVISTIMSRNFVTNGQQFAKDVWTILGYALEQTTGEIPTTFGAVGASNIATPTDEEACQMLQSAVDSQNPGAVQALNINWKAILQWGLQLLASLVAGAA